MGARRRGSSTCPITVRATAQRCQHRRRIFHPLPLELITGTLQLERSSSQPSASANLQLSDVRVDRLAMGNGNLKLRSNGTQARATFDMRAQCF